jgi:hypothetical protein
MAGILVSYKTLRGFPNKWPNRYPATKDIRGIFFKHKRIINLIHYAPSQSEALADQLVEINDLGGASLSGFQLNMAWPSPKDIDLYHCHTRYRYTQCDVSRKIVLQIGKRAFEMINNSPRELASRVAEYKYLVDYVLLDPSGGLGIPFNTDVARSYLEVLRAKDLGMGFGIAGGLSPTTLNLIEPLIDDFPDLSIDAEGKLRDSEDHLDPNLTREYIRKAFKLLC